MVFGGTGSGSADEWFMSPQGQRARRSRGKQRGADAVSSRNSGIRSRVAYYLLGSSERLGNGWLAARDIARSTLTLGKVSIMHLTPMFGEKLLCDITSRMVEMYQQARLREGAQGRT